MSSYYIDLVDIDSGDILRISAKYASETLFAILTNNSK